MITVEFKDFDDMMMFANQLASSQVRETSVQLAESVVAVQPAAAPVSVPSAQPAPVPEQQPVQQPTSMPAPVPQVPISVATYTLDDLGRAGTTLMDSGRQGELLNLLAQFGVATLPEIPPAQYGAFATALRGLGAQI